MTQQRNEVIAFRIVECMLNNFEIKNREILIANNNDNFKLNLDNLSYYELHQLFQIYKSKDCKHTSVRTFIVTFVLYLV